MEEEWRRGGGEEGRRGVKEKEEKDPRWQHRKILNHLLLTDISNLQPRMDPFPLKKM